MEVVVEIKPLNDYFLWIRFLDNKSGIIDVKPFIKSGISKKLEDKAYFQHVKIDEFGGICWDNGFDFCPEYLKSIIKNDVID